MLLAFCALFGRCDGRCVSRFQAFVHSGWCLSLVVVGVCLLMFWGFCSSWGAFCFAVLVVLPLVLCFFSSWCCGWQWSFDAGHCYWCLSFDVPGAGRFFFLLVVVCWRLGASARLGCSSSSLGPLGGCIGVFLVAFVFWRSGASAFSSSWWLRLPFVQ